MSRHIICGVCVTSRVYDLAADKAADYEKERHEKQVVKQLLSRLDAAALSGLPKSAGPADFITDGQGHVTLRTKDTNEPKQDL